METLLDLRRSRALRAVVVVLTAVAAVLLLAWTTVPGAVHAADQPATPGNEPLGGHSWGADGCTLPGASIDAVPGLFDFRHACIHHDGCYQGLDRMGAPAAIDRVRCDRSFREDLEASCEYVHETSTGWRARECESTAEAYFQVARSFGAAVYTGSGDAH